MKYVKVSIAAAACGLALAVAGCAAGGGKPADGAPGTAAADTTTVKPQFRYRVVADGANFYHISPQQPGGADEHLKKDMRITFVKRYGGYSEVLANGTQGYVASDDIIQISAQESAAEDAATLARQAPPNALAPTTDGPGGAYAIPPEATRETVLPVPDANPTPKPTPNSMFRY